MLQRLFLLSLVLGLSFYSYSEVVLTDQEFKEIKTALTEAKTSLTEQETEIRSLKKSAMILKDQVTISVDLTEMQKMLLNEQRESLKKRKIETLGQKILNVFIGILVGGLTVNILHTINIYK